MEAQALAKEDPEIDLSGNSPVYTPGEFLEPEEHASEQDIEASGNLEPLSETISKTEPESNPEARLNV